MAKDLPKEVKQAATDLEKEGAKVVREAEVHIDEFLSGLERNVAHHAMFKHFYAVVKGIDHATKAEFARMYEDFKKLPASELQ